MTMKIALLASILVLGCTCVGAQTLLDIETKYAKQVDVYSISERLWMTPSYDSQGQVCMMRVYPKAVSKNANYLDSSLDMDETLRFINELFPVYTRGRRGEGFGLSSLGGGVALAGFHYEHVKFVFVSSLRITKLPEKTDETFLHMDFPVDEAEVAEYRRQEAMKPDDQLIRERAGSPKVLEIIWANRKCVIP